ncbi:MAG: 3-phosphoshikimate 1-carboxyvinyltransferase [Myxococcota bacterium]
MDLRIEGGAPLCGQVEVPADKSIAHRALITAGLAHGDSTIRARAPGADIRSTAAVIAALGVDVATDEDGWQVKGTGPGGLKRPSGPLDCGNSGTTVRMMAGVLAGAGIESTLVGDASLAKRPMRRVCEPLRALGADIEGRRDGERELLPINVGSGAFRGGEQELSIASAQLKSALLLAGVAGGRAVKVREPAASRDHTELMLTAMGADITRESPTRVTLAEGARLIGRDLVVPGDFSSAAYVLSAAMLVEGSEVTVRDVGVNRTRTGMLEILEELGADVRVTGWHEEQGETICNLTVLPANLVARRPGDVPTVVGGEVIPRLIDELVVLAAVASAARGTTVVRDARELRVKESDRIAETVRLLEAFGITAVERNDGFSITGPQRIQPARIDVGADHRLALTAVVLALAAPGESELRNFEVADVSFPGFVDTITSLGARVGCCSP